VTSAPSTLTSISSTQQSDAHFHGRNNYFVTSDGERIQNLTVSFQLLGPMSGWCQNTSLYTCPMPSGNWSLQLNAYSPPGYAPGYMQYGVSYGGESPRFIQFFVEYWAPVTVNWTANCDAVSDGLFTNGTYLAVSALTNRTGNVVIASFKVVRFDGTILCRQSFDIEKYARVTYGGSNWWEYVPPMMGFTTEMIGAWNYQYALFEHLQGNFIWTANSAMTWTSAPPASFSYIQWKLSGTSEDANVSYAVPSQMAPNTMTQSVTKNACAPFGGC
jgi:hypothetical protein